MIRVSASRLSLLAVATLTVLAGCYGGPTATPTGETPIGGTDTIPAPTDTPSTPTETPCDPGETAPSTSTPAGQPSVAIPVRGDGPLPFDVNRTYDRTMTLLGDPGGVSPPSQVYLYTSETPWEPTVQDPFAQTLMDARETTNFTYERHDGLVMSLSGEQSHLQLLHTVAHEFTHNAQFDHVDDSPAMRAAFSSSYQRQRVGASVVEGSASYVALAYMLQYTDASRGCILAQTDAYRGASAAAAYNWAPYHFGRQYVAQRVDGPGDHWSVYEDPPETTEELIHGLEPGSEPPRDLSASVAGGEWTVTDRETRGEMFLRVVLTAELPEQRAARGAAGWGNDVVLTLERGDQRAYAWAIRWDSAADATEFQAAFAAAMDRRGERTDGRWLVDGGAVGTIGVTADTVVVLTGPESFVSGASASGANGSVTVTP